jgi:hypothetical protein
MHIKDFFISLTKAYIPYKNKYASIDENIPIDSKKATLMIAKKLKEEADKALMEERLDFKQHDIIIENIDKLM